MSRALLDTSAVIGGPGLLGVDPGTTAAISVITLGELRAGVRLATDDRIRSVRQVRYQMIRETFEPLPVDSTVAEHYGDILAIARSRQRTTRATDLLIIATASATGRLLRTLDERQAGLAALVGVLVG